MISKKAFTLVELLVVMAILAILSAIIIPNFRGYKDSAKNAKAAAMGREIFPALMWSFKQNGTNLNTSLLYNDIKYFTDITVSSCEIINSDPKLIKSNYSSEGKTYVIEVNVSNVTYVIKDKSTNSIIDQ